MLTLQKNMSYHRFGQTYRNEKPKKNGWSFFSKNKTKRVKHYSAGSITLSNPFKRAHKVKTNHFKFRSLVLPTILAIWLSLMLYLPYFTINNVTFNGLKIIKQTDIKLATEQEFFTPKLGYPASNFFLVNKKNISDFLQNKYALNNITVEKIFPNTLKITVEEKITSVIYDNGYAYYLMGEDGTIIKHLRDVHNSEFVLATDTPKIIISTTTPSTTVKLSNIKISAVNTTASSNQFTNTTHIPAYGEMLMEYGRYPLLYDLRHESALENTTIMAATSIKGLLAFYNALEKGKLAMVTYTTISEIDGGITLYTTQPWKIFIQPANDIAAQINNLKIILNSSKPKEYIDLRFGDRVYWK